MSSWVILYEREFDATNEQTTEYRIIPHAVQMTL